MIGRHGTTLVHDDLSPARSSVPPFSSFSFASVTGLHIALQYLTNIMSIIVKTFSLTCFDPLQTQVVEKVSLTRPHTDEFV